MRAEGREWEINAKALRGKGAEGKKRWEINAKAQKGKGAEGGFLTRGHGGTETLGGAESAKGFWGFWVESCGWLIVCEGGSGGVCEGLWGAGRVCGGSGW